MGILGDVLGFPQMILDWFGQEESRDITKQNNQWQQSFAQSQSDIAQAQYNQQWQNYLQEQEYSKALQLSEINRTQGNWQKEYENMLSQQAYNQATQQSEIARSQSNWQSEFNRQGEQFRETMDWNKEAFAQNLAWQKYLAENSAQIRAADLEKAGINPLLAYANGAISQSPVGVGSASSSSVGSASSPGIGSASGPGATGSPGRASQSAPSGRSIGTPNLSNVNPMHLQLPGFGGVEDIVLRNAQLDLQRESVKADVRLKDAEAAYWNHQAGVGPNVENRAEAEEKRKSQLFDWNMRVEQWRHEYMDPIQYRQALLSEALTKVDISQAELNLIKTRSEILSTQSATILNDAKSRLTDLQRKQLEGSITEKDLTNLLLQHDIELQLSQPYVSDDESSAKSIDSWLRRALPGLPEGVYRTATTVIEAADSILDKAAQIIKPPRVVTPKKR